MRRLLMPCLCCLILAVGCGKQDYGKTLKVALNEMINFIEISKKTKDATRAKPRLAEYEEQKTKLLDMNTELIDRLPELPTAKTRLLRKYSGPLSGALSKLNEERERLLSLTAPEPQPVDPGQPAPPDEGPKDTIVMVKGVKTLKGCVDAAKLIDDVIQGYQPLLWKKDLPLKLPEFK